MDMSDDSDDRLVRAADRVARKELHGFGFTRSEATTSDRGSSVVLANEVVALRFDADWLEGELAVSVQAVGGEPLPLDELVNLSGTGLSLRRISPVAIHGTSTRTGASSRSTKRDGPASCNATIVGRSSKYFPRHGRHQKRSVRWRRGGGSPAQCDDPSWLR